MWMWCGVAWMVRGVVCGVDGSGCACGWFGMLRVAWLRRDVWGDVARARLWAVMCGRGSQVGRRRGASKGRTTHDEAATTHVTHTSEEGFRAVVCGAAARGWRRLAWRATRAIAD